MFHRPEMMLAEGVKVAADLDPAEWLARSLLQFGRQQGTPAGAVIPTGFDAYARVFHPAADRQKRPVRWSEVTAWTGRTVHPEMQWEAISQPAGAILEPRPWSDEPAVGECPGKVRIPLTGALAGHTSTPERCWVCLWEGCGGIADAVPDAPRLRLPARTYVLLCAPLEVIAKGVLVSRSGWVPSPNLWWPEDRAWCVATEIDFRWTYVAGAQACIDGVLADARLEALATRPGHRGDYASDVVNGPVFPY